jgi:hypothetical protein
MVLLDDVVEIFDLADFNARLVFRIAAFDRRRVGSAFVDCDLLRRAVLTGRLAQKRSAALRSRLAVSRKSTVAPALSTARYKYFQTRLTFT